MPYSTAPRHESKPGADENAIRPFRVHIPEAYGPVDVRVEESSFELRSASDAALWAERGARIALAGAIRVNARALEKEKPDESYSSILATDGGIVEFEDGASASLVLGNGSLRASGYGIIRLGCRTAELTSRTRSNVLSIGNSGRIDLRNTTTVLVATDPANTPIASRTTATSWPRTP